MMINKRLIGAVPDCKSHIAANVAFQWLSLISNIAMMAAIAHFLGSLVDGILNHAAIGITVLVTALAAVVISFLSGIFGMILDHIPMVLQLHRAISIALACFIAIHIFVFRKRLL